MSAAFLFILTPFCDWIKFNGFGGRNHVERHRAVPKSFDIEHPFTLRARYEKQSLSTFWFR
jgi:hypothetical protein